MQATRIVTTIAGPIAVLCACASSAALAQTYPTKPVRVIVPWTPGGAADFLGRITAQKLGEAFGGQFLVDNRPGAAGQIGTELAIKAPPDGHTLLIAATAPNSTAPALFPKLSYDPAKDLAHITLLALTPYVLCVTPTLPARSLKELVALAKARPDELNFASPGNGTPNHLSGEMLKARTGIRMQHIPYKGSAPAIADVIGGQVPLAFENIAVVLPQSKAGKVRALAITSSRRSNQMPDTPTVAESGYPGFESVGWFGLQTTLGTPKEIVARLNTEMVRALKLPEIRTRIEATGAEVTPSTPEEFDAFNRREIEKWTKVIRESGVRLE